LSTNLTNSLFALENVTAQQLSNQDLTRNPVFQFGTWIPSLQNRIIILYEMANRDSPEPRVHM